MQIIITHMRLPTWLFIFSTLQFCANVLGATESADTVKAELISSVATVRAGEPFTIGVLLTIKPHWHLYWKYSGDAGLPTEILWQLPEGWSVGPLQWPLPKRFTENGPLTTFGYEDSVLLMAEVTPPKALKQRSAVRIAARANWMVCRELCLPGKVSMFIELPVSDQTNFTANGNPEKNSRFTNWLDQVPLSSESTGWNVKAVVSNVGGTRKKTLVILEFVNPDVASGNILDWIPAPTQNIKIRKIVADLSANPTKVSFQVQQYSGQNPLETKLESLLIYRDNQGSRRGVRLFTSLGTVP